ncbi:MAG: 5'/3'-nucleotidase SurE [Candidatus Heimdallarchaeaceae archaeon]
MNKKTILLTNDDGITSIGILSLRKHLLDLGNLMCIAPRSPSSAISKALTFHKPIRYQKITFDDGETGYSTSGSPADNVLVGFHLLNKKPDLVVSGINYGDNSSIHSIFTSGTCAAAFEAAFNGVPAIAFSAHVADDAQLIEQGGVNFEPMAEVARKIVKLVLDSDWPRDLAFLNINFPIEVTEETKLYVTRPTLYKYDNYMVAKRDPRGLPYLWLWGERKPTFPEGTDTWAVIQQHAISITPIGFNLHEKTDQAITLAQFIQKELAD